MFEGSEVAFEKQASLRLTAGERNLVGLDRDCIDVSTSCLAEFSAAVTQENHMLKRALREAVNVLDARELRSATFQQEKELAVG